METNRQILIYGNSVILGSIGASLRRCPGFDVTTLTTPLPDAQALDDAKPDILLIDLEATGTEDVFSLLRTGQVPVLIGISPDTNLVKVWSGRQLQELSLQGLLDLIKSAAND